MWVGPLAQLVRASC